MPRPVASLVRGRAQGSTRQPVLGVSCSGMLVRRPGARSMGWLFGFHCTRLVSSLRATLHASGGVGCSSCSGCPLSGERSTGSTPVGGAEVLLGGSCLHLLLLPLVSAGALGQSATLEGQLLGQSPSLFMTTSGGFTCSGAISLVCVVCKVVASLFTPPFSSVGDVSIRSFVRMSLLAVGREEGEGTHASAS